MANSESGKVLVLGASPNPSRYSYLATQSLTRNGFEVVPYGIRQGVIGDAEITNELPKKGEIDTVTMYLGAARQEEFIQYLLDLEPRRIIFNPGAENEGFARMAREKGIETENACTLVMLNLNVF